MDFHIIWVEAGRSSAVTYWEKAVSTVLYWSARIRKSPTLCDARSLEVHRTMHDHQNVKSVLHIYDTMPEDNPADRFLYVLGVLEAPRPARLYSRNPIISALRTGK